MHGARAKQYGPWRRIIGDVTRRFLRCGDLHYGFARARCPDCHHAMFVAFSCQQRCLCPSCHPKRTLLTAETIAQTIGPKIVKLASDLADHVG